MRTGPTGVALALLLAALAGCASRPAPEREPASRRAPTRRPTASSLVVALVDGRSEERCVAEARLIARGPESVPALLEALESAGGDTRQRILGVLDELGRLPEWIEADERAGLMLWRLAGGNGSPADRPRTLARLAVADESLREALRLRAGRPGPDRPLALFALAATGDVSAVGVLSGALDSDDPAVRSAAEAGLRRLTGVDWAQADRDQRARLLREWRQG